MWVWKRSKAALLCGEPCPKPTKTTRGLPSTWASAGRAERKALLSVFPELRFLNSVEGKGVGTYFSLSWPQRCIYMQWEARMRIKCLYSVSSTSNQFFTTGSSFTKSNAMAANHQSRTVISLLESAGCLPVNRFSTLQCSGPVLTWIVNENIDLAPKSFQLHWRRMSYSRQKKSRESQEAVLIN